jgi:hypothetical protein
VSQPFNVVKIEKERVSGVPVNLITQFNSGDMMKWDAVNLVATPIVAADAASATAAALFIGVSNDTNNIPSLNQALPVPRIAIITRGMCLFTVDDNATYNVGDAVTFGADPQKIRHTAASGSAVIGYVAPENFFTMSGPYASTSASASIGITGVQGVTQILINLRPQYTQLTTI